MVCMCVRVHVNMYTCVYVRVCVRYDRTPALPDRPPVDMLREPRFIEMMLGPVVDPVGRVFACVCTCTCVCASVLGGED